jgi:hypothetical protein
MSGQISLGTEYRLWGGATPTMTCKSFETMVMHSSQSLGEVVALHLRWPWTIRGASQDSGAS